VNNSTEPAPQPDSLQAEPSALRQMLAAGGITTLREAAQHTRRGLAALCAPRASRGLLDALGVRLRAHGLDYAAEDLAAEGSRRAPSTSDNDDPFGPAPDPVWRPAPHPSLGAHARWEREAREARERQERYDSGDVFASAAK